MERWSTSWQGSLLGLSWLFFLVFLVGPGFAGSIHGDGTRLDAIGCAEVFSTIVFMPHQLAWLISDGRLESFCPVLCGLANLAYVAVPLLTAFGQDGRPSLNYLLRWVLALGFLGYLIRFLDSHYPPRWAAYLWLPAIGLAFAHLWLRRRSIQGITVTRAE